VVEPKVFQNYIASSKTGLSAMAAESRDADDGHAGGHPLHRRGGMRLGHGGRGSDMRDPHWRAHEDEEEEDLMRLDKYYLGVVMKALMGILRDASLAGQWAAGLGVAIKIAKILGTSVLSELDEIVNGIVYRIYEEPGHSFEETLLDSLITLVNIVGASVSPHIPAVVRLVTHFFDTHLELALEMLETLCLVLPPHEFNGIMQDLVPSILKTIREEPMHEVDGPHAMAVVPRASSWERDSAESRDARPGLGVGLGGTSSSGSAARDGSGSRKTGGGVGMGLPRSIKIMRTIANMAGSLGEYRRQLVPLMLKLMARHDVAQATRREALCTVMHLARASDDLVDFAPRIIQVPTTPHVRSVLHSRPPYP